MTGIEVQVLRAIHELGTIARRGGLTGKGAISSHGQVARRLVLSDDYTLGICEHLVVDGYLRRRSDGKFKLTERSDEELSPVVSRGPIGVLKGGV